MYGEGWGALCAMSLACLKKTVFISVLAALSFLATPVLATKPIPVKISETADGAHITFAFPKLVGYIAKKSDAGMVLTLNTPLNIELPEKYPAPITNIEASRETKNRLRLDITLAAGTDFEARRDKRHIVIELSPHKEKAEEIAEAKPVEKKTPAPRPAGEEVELTRDLLETALKSTAAALEEPAPEKAEAKPETASAPVPATTSMPTDEEAVKPAETTITLQTLAPVKIAVFQRFNTLWIVMDAPNVNVSAPIVEGAYKGLLGQPKSLRFKDGMAYRYMLPQEMYITAAKENLTWILSLKDKKPDIVQTRDINVEFDKMSRRGKILASLKQSGGTLIFEDPAVGDTLYVVPTALAEEAIDRPRQTADLEIIPAAVGLVIRPIKDTVTINQLNDVVLVSAPDGLTLTAEGLGAPPQIGEGEAVESSLFDFPNWRMGGIEKFQRSKQQLQEKITAATTSDERLGYLLNLATLYFANNFGQETLGILTYISNENPDLLKNPNFMALRGAANAMSGHFKEALDDLSEPQIKDHPEVRLWIGYAAAATEQWRMANAYFPKTNAMLLQYPDNIAIPFTVYMAESALRLGNADTAQSLLDSINPSSEFLTQQHDAAMKYLRGEAARQQGHVEDAIKLWEPVAKGIDRLYHTKAELSLTKLLLQQKKITNKEAIDRIDNLRFAWRGDGLEVAILQNLGLLRVQNNEYLAGLEDLKTAATLSDYLQLDSTPIREEMRQIFNTLFVGGVADKISPLEAVSVYKTFKDVSPPPPQGVVAAMNFANYLIRMDLLEDAALLIEEQLKTGFLDKTLSDVGLQLSAVYLLDRRPQDALAALQKTAQQNIPLQTRMQRELLKARAQSQLKQTDAAITTLAGIHAKEARHLKADILWHAGKWAEAASAIEDLLPRPLPKELNDEDAQLIVNLAVARKLSGDKDALKSVQGQYGGIMATTKQATTFGVITRDGGESVLSDRDTVLKIAGEVDMFKGFLDAYKAQGSGS